MMDKLSLIDSDALKVLWSVDLRKSGAKPAFYYNGEIISFPFPQRIYRTDVHIWVEDHWGVIKRTPSGRKVVELPLFYAPLMREVAFFECAMLLCYDWRHFFPDESPTPVFQGVGAVLTPEGYYADVSFIKRKPEGCLYDLSQPLSGPLDLLRLPLDRMGDGLVVNDELFDRYHVAWAQAPRLTMPKRMTVQVRQYRYEPATDGYLELRLKGYADALLELLGTSPNHGLIPYDETDRVQKYPQAFSRLAVHIQFIKAHPEVYAYRYFND